MSGGRPYLTSQPLYSPFTPQVSYGTTTLLRQVTVTGVGVGYTLEYGANASGELAKATLPQGGWLRWTYRSYTYTGARTLRELEYRYLSASASGPETQSSFLRNDDPNLSYHPWTAVLQAGSGMKLWWLLPPGPFGGLVAVFDDRKADWTVVNGKIYTWAQDANGVPYMGSVVSSIDVGMGYQKQSKTEQTLDVYGNVLQTKVYDYGNLVTPARTYTHTYLSGANYTPRYIRNRLLTTTVTAGGSPVTLVSNVYDGYGQYPCNAQLTGYPIPPLRHDSSYSTSFWYRGNPTQVTRPAAVTCTDYDITGSVKKSKANGVQVSYEHSSQTYYAVPDRMTPNSDATKQTSFLYNANLDVTNVSGPNGVNGSMIYDYWGRPAERTNPNDVSGYNEAKTVYT